MLDGGGIQGISPDGAIGEVSQRWDLEREMEPAQAGAGEGRQRGAHGGQEASLRMLVYPKSHGQTLGGFLPFLKGGDRILLFLLKDHPSCRREETGGGAEGKPESSGVCYVCVRARPRAPGSPRSPWRLFISHPSCQGAEKPKGLALCRG